MVIATAEKEMKLVRSLHVYLQKLAVGFVGKDDYTATNITLPLNQVKVVEEKTLTTMAHERHGTYNAGNNDEKRYDAVQ